MIINLNSAARSQIHFGLAVLEDLIPICLSSYNPNYTHLIRGDNRTFDVGEAHQQVDTDKIYE